MTLEENIKGWAKQLRAITQTGIEYTNDVFDEERYYQLNAIANDMLAYVSGTSIETINTLLPIEQGYATPKIAVRAIVLRDNKILMVKEKADQLWTLPGGWCDVGLTAKENAEKEVVEETGLHTEAKKLVAFFDQTKYRKSITMQHIYTAYFLCEIKQGKLKTSVETIDVDFFDINDLPPLSLERMTQDQFNKALHVTLNNEESYFE